MEKAIVWMSALGGIALAAWGCWLEAPWWIVMLSGLCYTGYAWWFYRENKPGPVPDPEHPGDSR